MKLVLITLLFQTFLFARSVVPPKIVTPNVKIFSTVKILDDGKVQLKAVTYDEVGRFREDGAKFSVTQETYQHFKELSLPVFQMIPDPKFYPDEERNQRRGTAFSIGENLVLTNMHVLDDTFKNYKSCADFQIKNNEDRTFDCKKVHYCHAKMDVCLIEMAPLKTFKRDCLFCKKEPVVLQLADGPALKLKAHFVSTNPKEEVTTAIGNSGGWGIHLSQGKGVAYNQHGLLFWAPIRAGNSGGALLNDEGQVIGVVKQETQAKRSQFTDFVYNIAAPIDSVIEIMRQALANKPEILEKFNRSVVE